MSGPYYKPGIYACRVIDVAFMSSKAGNPMIVFKIEPISTLVTSFGPDGERIEDQVPSGEPYPRTARLTIVKNDENSMAYALQKLRYAGFDGERFEDLDLVGQVVRFECVHQPYNGEMWENWSLPFPPRENQPLENDPAVAKSLNAMFGKRLKEPAKVGAQPASEPVAASAAAVDDDIPF